MPATKTTSQTGSCEAFGAFKVSEVINDGRPLEREYGVVVSVFEVDDPWSNQYLLTEKLWTDEPVEK